jgi:hypothetical protein
MLGPCDFISEDLHLCNRKIGDLKKEMDDLWRVRYGRFCPVRTLPELWTSKAELAWVILA